MHFFSHKIGWPLFLFAVTGSAFANLPSGGNGTGANVTITTNTSANTITMANGIVTAVINYNTSQILQLTYLGHQITAGGTAGNSAFYWQGQNSVGEQTGANGILSVVVNPATNSGNFAEICIANLYANQGSTNAYVADAYYYFALGRGSPGIYAAEDMERSTNTGSALVAGGADIPSLTGKMDGSFFNWMGQDSGRHMLRQGPSDIAIPGINNCPKEVTLLTNGVLAGQFECKYDYSGDLNALHFFGWCSTTLSPNFGAWMIHPSSEYFSSGPKHPEIIGQIDMFNCTFKSVHFGFGSDLNFTNGETWSRVCGPLFIYFNQVPSGTANPQNVLYADAAAQSVAEQGAWPYTWLADTNYAQASQRGTVTGKLIINDSGNPNASAAGMWVGVEQQPPSSLSPATTDFQFFSKNLQFWVQTDTNGNFSIPNVVAGNNYTLLAFGPGAIGLYQSQSFGGTAPPVQLYVPSAHFSVPVSGGQTNNLGNVIWAPARVGATVWEMGVPDRDTTEFRHGADYWHGDLGSVTNLPVNWAQWQDYNLDFPNGVNYTNGQSRWSADWDYAQPTSLDPTTGNLNGTTQNIFFNLPATPANSSQASIYFAIAGDYSGPVEVTVNNTLLNGTGFFPYYSDDDPMIRMESHGVFCDYRLNFAGNLLHAGQNEIRLNMRKGGYFSDGILYDYIRLELTGYIPPTPSGLTAIAGNGLVVLDWPASSGATGYNVLRSTTSGSGYTTLATNIIGPTVGSDVPDATYTDRSAANGTPYYYVVSAVNPNGSSTNSVPAAATPSASTPAAPAAPTGLTVTPGNLKATLTWNASPGAATYAIQRTVINAGANANDPGAETVTLPNGCAPTNIVNRFVTTTNYTDTGLANNVLYAYTVSAANANGQSAPSAPVGATTSPSFPTPPTGLGTTVSSNQVNLSWNQVSIAETYIVSRATSIAGTYAVVDDPEWLTLFSDTGLNYNATYYYEVASANLAGVSTNSAPWAVTTPPAPPAPITAFPGPGQIFIDWGDSAGATNYVLQRSTTSGGPYTTVVSTTNSSYLDTGLVNGTAYYYVVYAVGPNGQSPLSVQTSATPGTTPQMIKSDTATMNNAGDWSGVTPAIGQVGLFNNIISAVNEAALTLGGDIAVGGLVFTNNLNGNVAVAAGNTLTLGGSGLDMSKANYSVTFNNPITLAAAQIWNITNAQSLTINGAFTSAGNPVIQTGGGTLYLGTGTSDAGANIQVNAGIAQANVSSGIMISLNGGTFNNNGSYVNNPINVMSGGTEQNVGGNRTWSGNLTGSGPLTVIASSTHTWSGNNSGYTGAITLQGGGALRLSTLTAVSATTTYNFNGGTMNANASGLFSLGSLSGAGTINTASGENFSIGTLGATTAFSGAIAGAGFIQKDGGGNLTLSGANTYSGGTIINSGILQIGSGGTAGTLGAGNITDNATLAFNRSDAIDDTGFGVISGTGVLDKQGAGRLALTKAHSYSSATTIESGTLALINSGTIANSSGISISSGALFDVSGTTGGSVTLANGKSLSGNGSMKGNFTIGSGAILSPGMNGIGTLTFSNSLTLSAGSTNIFEISKSPLTNDVAKIFGALTNGGTLVVTNIGVTALTNGDSFQLYNAASYNGAFANVILPSLPAGLGWNTHALNTAGTLSVVIITQPVIGTVSLSGGGLALAGTGGVADANFYLLGSTNLSTPVTNWTRLLTNQFDNSGNFNFTNAMNTNSPQSFYLLQLP